MNTPPLEDPKPLSLPVRWYRNAVEGLPPAFWYVWVGVFINRLGGFVVPFLAIYLTEQRGFSIAQAGTIASLYGGGSIASGPIGGQLADRVGRRATMLMSLVLGSVFMIGLGLARAPAQIGLAALVLGFCAEMFRPAMQALVADVVRPEERQRAYGLLYWAVNLGFSFAPVIAGFMARRSFFALFVGDAATTLMFAGVIWFKVPETRPEHSAAPSSSTGGFSVALRDPIFAAFVGAAFLLAVVIFQFQVALALDMRAHGGTPEQFGSVLALNGILIVLFQPAILRRLKPVRRSRVLALASVLTATGFGVQAFATSPWHYAGAAVIWTLGEIMLAPISSSVVADLAPLHARGRYQGAFNLAWGGAAFFAPLSGAWVLEHFGGRVLWAVCFALGIACASLHFALAGARGRRLAELHPGRSALD